MDRKIKPIKCVVLDKVVDDDFLYGSYDRNLLIRILKESHSYEDYEEAIYGVPEEDRQKFKSRLLKAVDDILERICEEKGKGYL